MQRTTRLRVWRATTWDSRPWLEYENSSVLYHSRETCPLTCHQILEVCYKCGVKVVTVYAFSIENFNRPKREVEGLMLLAKTKLSQLMQHGEVLDRYSARIKICGKREMIPTDVLEYVDRAVHATRNNHGFVPLNQGPNYTLSNMAFQGCPEYLLPLQFQGGNDKRSPDHCPGLPLNPSSQELAFLADPYIPEYQD